MLLFLIDICRALWRGYTAAKYWLALKITGLTGTMECALFFALLAVAGFPGAPATLYQYVQWFSTTFLQLVMLPILSAGQKVTQAQQDAHHSELQQMHASHRAEIARLHNKLDRIAPSPVSPDPGHCATPRDPKWRPKDPKTGRFLKREQAA